MVPARVTEAGEAGEAGEAPLPPVKFLLVDDLEDNLLVLEALLRRDDLELLMARSGPEALELLLVHDVALALVDVQMPEMDGFELAETIRSVERTKHIPIIFVTAGHRDTSRVFRGYDAGAVDFLFKPLEPRILRNKTETFFQLYRQRQQLAQQLDQLKESEEALAKVNNELAETLRLNELFMAAVGHDLRSPLSAVLTGAEMLLMTTKEPGTRSIGERVKSSGKRMAGMINDLFDLARARLGGGIELHKTKADLGEIARKVVAEIEVSATGRTITLERQGDQSGEWDVVRLEQVVSNLVGNAVRHGAKAQPIAVTIKGEAKRVTLAVENGGKVPDEVLPNLFAPFRAKRSARAEGLGLGLYIVHQIVQAHGGTLEVRSEGEKTRFTAAFPRV